MIVFDVDNVTKVYPRQSVPANKDISLQIHRGEIFGLPGGNAGKTTLVRRQVALLQPAAGQLNNLQGATL